MNTLLGHSDNKPEISCLPGLLETAFITFYFQASETASFISKLWSRFSLICRKYNTTPWSTDNSSWVHFDLSVRIKSGFFWLESVSLTEISLPSEHLDMRFQCWNVLYFAPILEKVTKKNVGYIATHTRTRVHTHTHLRVPLWNLRRQQTNRNEWQNKHHTANNHVVFNADQFCLQSQITSWGSNGHLSVLRYWKLFFYQNPCIPQGKHIPSNTCSKWCT